jgi:hypothetical protein
MRIQTNNTILMPELEKKTKIFKLAFSCENGNYVNGFTEAVSLAEAMKRIATAYPDISHIDYFYEDIK